MLTRFLFIFILLLSFNYSHSQKKHKHDWRPGMIELRDGTATEDEIAFDPFFNENIVLIRNNDQIITLTPLNVASFSFYDKKLKTTRKFYSLHIASSEGGYARKQFIEVQYESPYIALLSREFKEIDDIFSTSHNKIQSNTLPVQERYLLSPQSNKATLINRLNRGVISNRGIRTKKEVYSFFGNLKEPMKKYIKQQGLSFIKVEDLIRMLEHFTYLKEKK